MKINLKFHITNQLQHLLDVLKDNNGKSRFVGGIVRDAIIGQENADIDIATTLKPNDIMNILSENKIRYLDLGSKYGTITALVGDEKAEITTLRIDTECDGRHTNPIFTDDFEQDALRRDFTINAMSYCPFAHELYDYTGGYDDLIAGKVRFIGDALLRIEEDHLRILRFFRFSNRFAKFLDEESLESCIKLRHMLNKISKERILMELNRMILSDTADKVFGQMFDAKIMAEIMPGAILDLGLLNGMSLPSYLRYAALLHNTKVEILDESLDDLRFSKIDKKLIINLVLFRQKHNDLSGENLQELKNIFYPLWLENIRLEPYIFISKAEKNKNFDELMKLIKTPPPKFPINGDDLISLGIEGRAIGLTLEKLKSKWIESEFSLSKKDLEKLVIS